jgi:hypothetical protein
MDQLKVLQTQAKGDAEIASFELLKENADAILQAANKLPPPVNEKEKGKNKKGNDKN